MQPHLACKEGFSTRRDVVPSNSSCPSGCATPKATPLCLTLICRCRAPFKRSFAVLRTLGQLLPQFVTFESFLCSSRGESVVGHTPESLRGQRSSTMMYYVSFTTPLTQGLSSMGVLVIGLSDRSTRLRAQGLLTAEALAVLWRYLSNDL